MYSDIKDPDKWDLLKDKITDVVGFNCSNYSNQFLKRRINVRLRSLNLDSYSAYSSLLSTQPEEKSLLEKELTIHVTHFFRDKIFYDTFENDVIPGIISHKKANGQKKIRIWSAGCSTGEEPYSIVICFKKVLGLDFQKFDIEVIATDYDAGIIERAKEGIYADFQFRETEPEIKERFFKKDTEGDYHIREDIKKYVQFNSGDILKSNRPKEVDILFCRNTVIYFEQETKARLYVDFFNLINPGGFFIMGKTETLNGPARELFKIYNARERIYQKS